MNAKEYIHALAKIGQHYFTGSDILKALNKSKANTLAALQRLQEKGEIARVTKGFYLIVPPQYQIYNCLPAEQFIPDLMKHLMLPYYVGVLSAAQYYGAAHQKPQQFQVVTEKYLPTLNCGKIITTFIKNKIIKNVPFQQFNTATGYIKVSTSEATAIDLIKYPKHSGGINNIATVLIELAESMSPENLENCIMQIKPELVILQRLGYLLDFIDQKTLSKPIQKIFQPINSRTRPLINGISTRNTSRDKKWNLYINYNVEPDL